MHLVKPAEPDDLQATLAASERLTDLGSPHLTGDEIAERAGVDRGVADRLWRALGFPDTERDERVFTDQDVRALKIATEGLDRLAGDKLERAVELIVREARILSAHLADVAEIEIDAMVAMRDLGLRQDTLAAALEHGLQGSDLEWLIGYDLRRQLHGALRRRSSAGSEATIEMAVAFIDLVDYTALTSRIGSDALGPLLARFESLVFDTVAEAYGRVVKLIGDEAMIVWDEPEVAAKAALDIVARCGSDGIPPARAGIAFGAVLPRDGDYFGQPVNAASRIVACAAPGSVVVDSSVACVLEGSSSKPNLERLPPQKLKGLGEVEVWSLR
jgi:adenylate cyclase